jgi:diacylglycerol kinase
MKLFLYSRLQSFKYAFAGLEYVLRTQKNAWIHALATGLVFCFGIWLALPAQSWAILFLTIGVVWMAECMNTAIEAILDLVSPQKHPLAKIGKDAAAAGVFVVACSAVLVGLAILGPPLIQRLIFPQ